MTGAGDRYEVAVVGAGPAGAAAAQALAAAGVRTALLERCPLPRYKTCGGGLVPRALAYLPVDVAAAVQRTCHRVEVYLHGPDAAYLADADPAPVTMTMREDLDALLADAAVRAGADLRAPCEVETLRVAQREVELATSTGPLRAGWVIAADGATGSIARAAGWAPHDAAIPALEYEVQVPDPVLERLSASARFDLGFLPHGYAWVFPKRRHLSIGVLRMRRGPVPLRSHLVAYLEHVGIGEIEHVERHGYVIPIRPRAGGFARNRTLLVGDAAGFADPITAEGISYAVLSGQLAARALVDGDGDASAVPRRYHHALRAPILSELRAARLLALPLYDLPRVRRSLVRRCGRELVGIVADVAMGRTTYRQTLGSPPYLAGLLTRRDRPHTTRIAVARSPD